MSAKRIAHDCAVACAYSIVECIHGLRDEEKMDLWHEVLERVEATIECAFIDYGREQARLNPCN